VKARHEPGGEAKKPAATESQRIRQFQQYLQKGKRRNGRHSNPVARQQMCQNGHNAVEKAYRREVGDGAGEQAMEREMCTEHYKEGRGWERQY
jgi:hypothetical protein